MTGGPLTQHPDYERFRRAMDRFLNDGLAVKHDDAVYRSVSPKYGEKPDLLNGQGASLNGGRWTTPGGASTLYAASTPELALRESLAFAVRSGIPARKLLPRLIRGIRLKIRAGIDLRDGDIRRSLGVSLQRMRETDWNRENLRGREAVTQAIGRAAAGVGVEALIVPTQVKPDELNIAVFVPNLKQGSVLEIWE